MTSSRLLDEVTAAGGSLRVQDGRLRLSAPRPLPAALVDALRTHKAELLAWLAARAETRAPTAPQGARSRAAPAPDTPVVRRYVYHFRLSDSPDRWPTLISDAPTVEEARRILEHQFGAARVLDVWAQTREDAP